MVQYKSEQANTAASDHKRQAIHNNNWYYYANTYRAHYVDIIVCVWGVGGTYCVGVIA